MNIAEAIEAVKICIQCNVVPMLWGKPGIGKSDMIRQIGAEYSVPVIDIRLSQCDPVLLSGVPSVENGITIWNTPTMWPTVEKDGPEGILFLDEINTAPPTVTAAAYQLILDRRLGNYELPTGWHVVAAGNNAEDRAQINKMGTALANRFAHFEVEEDIHIWSEWAFKEKLHPNLISFLQYRPELLHNMDTTKSLKAFPSPRTWHATDRVYKKSNADMLFTMIAATVGKPAAVEFSGYLNIFKTLPSLKQMIADPDAVSTNVKASVMFALASLLTQSLDLSNSSELFSIVNRLPIEFQTFIVRSFYDQQPKMVSKIPEITQWLIKNPELFSNED